MVFYFWRIAARNVRHSLSFIDFPWKLQNQKRKQISNSKKEMQFYASDLYVESTVENMDEYL